MIADVVPLDLLAIERKRIYKYNEERGRVRASIDARTETLTAWQTRWTDSDKGKWTKCLITDVRLWQKRRDGEVSLYLAQFLSGHGYFRQYLHRRGKVTTRFCRYCNHDRDDAEHTFFASPRWTDARHRLQTITGDITPDNVVKLMIISKRNWDNITRCVTLTCYKVKRQTIVLRTDTDIEEETYQT